jgi:glycosyltransferase involved in cell wall biosynthesis
VLDVVRAVAALPRPAAVTVVGAPGLDDGRYLRAVRSAGEQLLGERFRYAGPTDDVPGTLRCLDVLVNASTAEPFGLSVLEAQACGVPVVAARAGGLPDFVHDGRTGLLFTPGDVSELAVALDRVLEDGVLRRRLTAEAHRQAVTEHSLDARARRIAALYRSVAAGRWSSSASGSRVRRSSAVTTAAAGTTEA